MKANNEEEQRDLVYFVELGLPNFLGTESPEEAELWLLSMEQEFEALQCSDDEFKLRASVFLLNDADRDWWSSTKVNLEGQYGMVSWDMFKAAFRQRYFPRLKRDKAREFWHLRQEDMTVQEYSRKFSSLLMYVPDIASDNEEKAQLFLEGLRPDIYFKVVLRGDRSFEEMLNTAYSVEGNIGEIPFGPL